MKSAIVIAATCLCVAAALISGSRASAESTADSSVSDPSETSHFLRNRLFEMSPERLGLSPTKSLPNVWAVTMEWVQSDAVVTLQCVGEGSTSLYFSTGGGFIGGGEYPTVRSATKRLLEVAEAHLRRSEPAQNLDYPPSGTTRFYLLTYSGVRIAEATDRELRQQQHPLHRLFTTAQEVITAYRIAEQQREGAAQQGVEPDME